MVKFICLFFVFVLQIICSSFVSGQTMAEINILEKLEQLKQKPKDYLVNFGYMTSDEFNLNDKKIPEERLREFQEYAGIQETGQLDEATVNMMLTPRCGLPENVTRILQKQGSAGKSRTRRYMLQGSTWSPLFGKIGKNELKWTVLTGGRTLDYTTVVIVMREAITFWERETNVKFIEVPKEQVGQPGFEQNNIEILVSFNENVHDDPYPFDGPGGTLAHAFYPHTNQGLSGDVHFDNAEDYTYKSPEGRNLLWVATHELGHSLGLEHSDVRDAVMYPWYTKYKPGFQLHPDDVLGIQALYGVRTEDETTTTTTTTESTTTKNQPPTTTEQATTSTESPTTTSQSITTTEQATTTTESPTTKNQPPTTTKQTKTTTESPTTTSQPITTTEQATTTKESSTTKNQPDLTTEQATTTTTNEPVTTTEQATATVISKTTTNQQVTTTEKTTSTTKSKQEITTTNESPTTTNQPTLTTEDEATKTESQKITNQPARTTEEATTTSEQLTTTAKLPTESLITDAPVITIEPSLSTESVDITTTEAATDKSIDISTESVIVSTDARLTSTEGLVTSTEAPLVTTEPLEKATEKPIATTEGEVTTTESLVTTTESVETSTEGLVTTTEVPITSTESLTTKDTQTTTSPKTTKTTTTTKKITRTTTTTTTEPSEFDRWCPPGNIKAMFYAKRYKLKIGFTTANRIFFLGYTNKIPDFQRYRYYRKSKIPASFDAILSQPINGAESQIIFAGKYYYIYKDFNHISGPHSFNENQQNPLQLNFPQYVKKIDAAFLWPRNGRNYFFSGTQYWRYNHKKRTFDKGYPKDINRNWRGLPSTVNAAFSHQNRDISIFISGNKVYWFDDINIRVKNEYSVERYLRCNGADSIKGLDVDDDGIDPPKSPIKIVRSSDP